MRQSHLGRILLGLFVLSGFAGLVYQSIWSHYLGLVLGHAAYAQTLVLAIFMGGMAVGAWLASRWSARWRHLVLAYAVIEVAIGVIGLAFHPVFVAYLGLSHDTVLPALGSPLLAHAWQWGSGAMLMVPQSVLLGMTFPILSAGYLRLAPGVPGEVLGGLYFSNSLGAAFGALATTFLLLPAVGMPGSVLTAGLLNILVGLGAWAIWRGTPAGDPAPSEAPPAAAKAVEQGPGLLARLGRIVLVAAFITGATSFVYEIGWVRLLNQALGTTVHSFELMLAAFILGLACGGYWVRHRAAAITDAIRHAAYAQVLMGLAALMSVLVFAQSFRWVGWLMLALARNDAGYAFFSAGSGVIALLVMFPAAFFAGMTLPLFTLALLRGGGGERHIGRVYASNTLGAIIGVLVTVHVLVPLLGVRLSIILSAALDAGLGLYLLRYVSPARTTSGFRVAGAATLACTAIALVLGRHDPEVLAAGVFRTGATRVAKGVQVPFFRDGKTATVSVATDSYGGMVIATNGKPDASLTLDPKRAPKPDEVTMTMAGALPLALHPAPRNVAVIGWGSGLTTHTLLGSPLPVRVETVEIEPAMHEGARLFGERVSRGYADPRSVLRIEDARTYFSTANARYDVIVSEPSNPWVSGVASLFTVEFYRFLRGHLAADGMVVQWIHAYELNDRLLATMIAALLEVFPDSDVYLTNTADLLLVAHTGPRVPPRWDALAGLPLRRELQRVGIGSPHEIALRKVGGPEVLATYVQQSSVSAHSDFFPVVSLNAPRSRFKGEAAVALLDIVDGGMPVAEMLAGREEPASTEVSYDEHSRFARSKQLANAIRGSLLAHDVPPGAYADRLELYPQVQALLRISQATVAAGDIPMWTRLAATVAEHSLAQLPASQQVGVWIQPAWIDAAAQPPLIAATLAALQAAGRRDAAAMLATAEAVLAFPANEMSPYLRELMLVQAQVGTIALGNPLKVAGLVKRHPTTDVPEARHGFVRRFLYTWAARQYERTTMRAAARAAD